MAREWGGGSTLGREKKESKASIIICLQSQGLTSVVTCKMTLRYTVSKATEIPILIIVHQQHSPIWRLSKSPWPKSIPLTHRAELCESYRVFLIHIESRTREEVMPRLGLSTLLCSFIPCALTTCRNPYSSPFTEK